jgi:hypothetical protein
MPDADLGMISEYKLFSLFPLLPGKFNNQESLPADPWQTAIVINIIDNGWQL